MSIRRSNHGADHAPPKQPGRRVVCAVLALAGVAWGCDGQLSADDMTTGGEPGGDAPQVTAPNGPSPVGEAGDNNAPVENVNNAASPTTAMGDGPDMNSTTTTGTTIPGTTVPTKPAMPSGNALAQSDLFTCAAPESPRASEGRLRLIGRDEWRRNAGRWVGSQAEKNPFDPNVDHAYSSYSTSTFVDEAKLGIFLGMIGTTADRWAKVGVDDPHPNNKGSGHYKILVDAQHLNCFLRPENDPDRACVTEFVTFMLERGVLYRSPTVQERDDMVAFTQKALGRESSRAETVEQVLSAARLLPGALFRSETGEGAVDENGRVKLSNDEIAQALAYALDGRAPDALSAYISRDSFKANTYSASDASAHLHDITLAAKDGSISDPATIERLVRDHIGGQVGPGESRQDLLLETENWGHLKSSSEFWLGHGVRAFFREWLGYSDVTRLTGKADVLATTGFSNARIEQSYRNNIDDWRHNEPYFVNQLDEVIARVVVEDADVFKNLLTTSTFYVPAKGPWESSHYMAHVYNVTTPITKPTRAKRWVDLKGERGGVLTHPAWLAAHGHPNENDPSAVERGKWVREMLLCQDVPDAPAGVDAMLDPDTEHLSARERVKDKTEQADCAGCHKMMNPLGYTFEIYNHAGYLRAEDHGAPPNGSSTLELMPDPALEGAQVKDAIELSALLADSSHAKRCFIRQSFRYFMGRNETRQDACMLTQMEAAYDQEGSFADMLVALFTSDTFLYRWDADQGGDR